MNRLTKDDVEMLIEEVKKMGVGKLRIWCGAGVSAEEPCSLPLGNGLSDAIFKNYISYAEQIDIVWKKCNEYIKNYTSTHDSIRPEVIISCITRYGALSSTKVFYEKFAALDAVRYNSDHRMLAYYVYSGGTVFTTNFDICIEKAYEKEFNEIMRTVVMCNGKVIKYLGKNGGEVIHLHGIFKYGEVAGASIENVMKGYDKDTELLIRDSLSDNMNLFVGYSFSDDYDLNYLYRAFYKKKYDIFICSHMKNDNNLSFKVMEIFGRDAHVIEYNTKGLLEKVVCAATNTNRNFETPKVKSVDWSSLLKFPENMEKGYQLIYSMELINQFQISHKAIGSGLVQKYKQIGENLHQELGNNDDILQYNLIVNSSITTRKGKVLKDEWLKSALKNRLENNFFRLNSDIKKMEKINQLKGVYEKLQEGRMLTNKDHELISIYMRVYTVYYLLGCKQDRFELLKNVNKYICTLNYNRGEEVYMFAASQRYHFLLTQDENAWKDSMKIYYDVGHLGGVISTLIAGALVRSKANGKCLFLQKEWKDAMKLAGIIKEDKYKIIGLCMSIFDLINRLPILGHLLRWIITF